MFLFLLLNWKLKTKQKTINYFATAQLKPRGGTKSTKTSYNITGWLWLLLVGSHVRGRYEHLRVAGWGLGRCFAA